MKYNLLSKNYTERRKRSKHNLNRNLIATNFYTNLTHKTYKLHLPEALKLVVLKKRGVENSNSLIFYVEKNVYWFKLLVPTYCMKSEFDKSTNTLRL